MASLPARRWLAVVLLTVVLAPDAFPVAAARHRCACGMVVGCCCLRKAAMKAGDHCALRGPARSCGLRPGRDRAVESQPPRHLAAWVGMSLRDSLRIPRSPSGTLLAFDESPPETAGPAPPVPPPRQPSPV